VSAALQVPFERVLAFRVSQTHLARRLSGEAHGSAAWGGLQDTVPRAGLTALHARMRGVNPASWEHPSLWQVWFRMSDYVIPAQDFGVFTLGALPRERESSEPLLRTAAAAFEVLCGRSLPNAEVVAGLAHLARAGDRPHYALREACAAGRYRIRWDARTVTVIPADTPPVEVEEARRELARRFLRWHGPGTARRFARWAHVPPGDAAETFRQLAPELAPVAVNGERRVVHLDDEQALRNAEPAPGARFLMLGDPLLALDRELTEPPAAPVPPPVRDDLGRPVTRRLCNSLAGRILAGGVLVGSWGRREHHLSVYLWGSVDAATRQQVLAEAESFAGPIGRPIEVRWLSS
jgi:Winged helix DNA-binding domain